MTPTYVLIPGACHGAWCFDDLAADLRGRGHRVLSYTLTGVAERANLANGGVNLDTHVTDVLNALGTVPDPTGLVLVGHSYGGMVITAVADRIAAQVDSLVYLDAFIPEDGDSCWTLTNDEQRAWYAAVDATGWGVPPLPFFDDRATAHPLASLMQPIRLTGATNRIRRRVFVYAERWPTHSPFAATYAKVRDHPGWRTYSLDGAHNLMRDKPEELVQILLDATS
ncbi:alpha/beta fold hydrolase [Mycobacterium yunnanensis]|uniref:Alpha/beta fold hydrolase n=1 Tax=Mycobacterium yunnanensis TaxID=368477 RepID=A0A9X3C4G4_9MYCO|nr:alpha/beta fold hydrolase [Mycobacterium yunnanensis]MCV7424431.1 alpha/beta fold hydrolase [Mycobacterium yunnanensis]